VRAVLGAAGDVAHEALQIGADALELAPLPGLAPAARTLLGIWDALQDVDVRGARSRRMYAHIRAYMRTPARTLTRARGR
jgi:hypothetical protein